MLEQPQILVKFFMDNAQQSLRTVRGFIGQHRAFGNPPQQERFLLQKCADLSAAGTLYMEFYALLRVMHHLLDTGNDTGLVQIITGGFLIREVCLGDQEDQPVL